MKSSPFSLGLLAIALAFASAAPAAMISSFEFQDYRTADFYPYFQADHTSTTSLASSPGLAQNTSSPRATGWSLEKNNNLFMSFTITPAAGYQLTLTDLNADPSKQGGTGSPTTYYWGYRINEGSGYGAWTFSEDRAYGATGTFQPWDFADFTTMGTVQFGYFAFGGATSTRFASPGAETGGYEQPELAVFGSVAAIPEPSTVALCLAGAGLAVVLTRRNKRANA